MTDQYGSKINQLLRQWPDGTVGTLGWLLEHGVSRRLADWHARSGWLDRIGPGAFVRGGDKPDWTGGLYALQKQVGLSVHIGGLAALELQGQAHFIQLGRKQVSLVSDRQERLPSWFRKYDWKVDVEHRCMPSLFDDPPSQSLVALLCGKYSVLISTRERAIMEVMHLARSNADIEHARELMSGLGLLRPAVVQPLLEDCRSTKVKRFFLWCAEDDQHPWLSRLDLSKIDLGAGKRQFYSGGVYNSQYRITVPPAEDLPSV